jgi:Colicin-E5 Imm protein
MERNQLYGSSRDYFDLNGMAVMYLAPDAAIGVCAEAAQRGLVVVRIEGGRWHAPGFEARVDCIWDGADPPLDLTRAATNNARAADFIRRERAMHGAFVITDAPLTGYRHKRS